MIPAVVILAGPTAAGKSAMAMEIARRFPAEIVSADSLQIFRELDIGSAKPPEKDRNEIPHHMIDCLAPDQEVTAAWYAKRAGEVARSIVARGKVPLFVGGSGFYLRAFEHPPQADAAAPNTEIHSGDHEELQTLDSEAAERIHPNDRYRISRAISLARRGVRATDAWKSSAQTPPAFHTIWFGIGNDRKETCRRIDLRVDEMYERGLTEETDRVRRHYPDALPRLRRAIGYRDALGVLEGSLSLQAAKDQTKVSTRQYAKRQMTWFRAEKRIRWMVESEALKTMIEALHKVMAP